MRLLPFPAVRGVRPPQERRPARQAQAELAPQQQALQTQELLLLVAAVAVAAHVRGRSTPTSS